MLILNHNANPSYELTFVIKTTHLDNRITEDRFHIGDKIHGLRFKVDDKINTIDNGMLEDIKYIIYPTIRDYSVLTRIKSSFAEDVRATELCIRLAHTDTIVTVDTKSIIQKESITDFKKIFCYLEYTAKVHVTNKGISEVVNIQEGSYVKLLKFLDRSGITDEIKTKNARVVAFKYNNSLIPTYAETIIDNETKEIALDDIISAKEICIPITPEVSVSDTIDKDEDGIVHLSKGRFTDNLFITKDTTIIGEKFAINGSDMFRDVTTFSGETIFNGRIIVSSDANLELRGLVLTTDALISLGSAKNFKLINCIVSALKPHDSHTTFIRSDSLGVTNIEIKNCYFGNNYPTESGDVTSLFDFRGTISNDSIIHGCYFKEAASRGESINITDVENESTITISNNLFEMPCNEVRVGTRLDRHAIFNFRNNGIIRTCPRANILKFIKIEPDGKRTITMSNVEININNTLADDNTELFYLYTTDKDIKFDDYNKPTVKVNGKVIICPIK